jgi:hypothetical protein
MQRVITDYFPDARPPCRWRQRINTAAIALPLQFRPLASSSATAFLGVYARNYTMMMKMMMMMQPLTPFHGEQDFSFPAFRSLGFW